MAEHLQNVIYVYDKNKKLIAKFGEEQQGLKPGQELSGLSPDAMREMMVSPVVHIESNGASTFTFQMIANSIKWQSIKDPENLYYVNGRYYTPLTENAYEYSGEDTARIVTVTCVETWYLLSHKYNQAYNCGIYCYAKARFQRKTATGAIFTINASECSNPGNTISSANAWAQVKNWRREDDDKNILSYAILTDDKNKPTNWENAPAAVNIKSISVSGSTATVTLENRVQAVMRQTYDMPAFKDGQYSVYIKLTDNEGKPLSINPEKFNKVVLSYTEHETITTKKWNADLKSYEVKDSKTTFKNLEFTPSYEYTASGDTFGIITQSLPKQKVEEIHSNNYAGANITDKTIYRSFYAVTIEYPYNNMGDIKAGATCTLAYGAEVVDEHTFVILPKANKRYMLTINGTAYNDNEVKDQRGVVMPRGSGGYAMWAALKGSGWGLGICDVIAKDFDPAIDYGCFNVEEDMKDILTNIQNIRSVYGGILVWDSERKLLHYRAENNEDYQAYNDDFNKWKGYVFREGKNLTNQPVITYDNDIITKAYLLGYGNLNIRNINNGKSYIEDYSYTKNVYEGYLSQELIYDTNDEGGQKQLLYWGRKELKKRCKPRKTISLEVTDVRTVNGLEHEVFDINDVVKVYYHDSHDDTEHIEEQRIILWEYNVFAYWDCQVELGDKTSNLTEIFKLVYNKTLNTPDTNGSGQLPGNQIVVGGNNNNNIFGSNNNTITGRFNLISQTTTANTDAIAGLIIDTSYNYSYAQLFSQFQEKLGDVITNTYAGLTTYADNKMAYAVLKSKFQSENLVTGELAKTEAALKTYANEVGASARLFSKGLWETTDGKLTQEIKANAEFKTTVTKEYAKIDSLASYSLKDGSGKTFTLGGMQTYVDDRVAKNEFLASLKNNNVTTYAGLKSMVTKEVSNNQLIASFERADIRSVSTLYQYAQEHWAGFELLAELEAEGIVSVSGLVTQVTEEFAESDLVSEFKDTTAYVKVYADRYGAEVHLMGNVIIDSGKTFEYFGDRVGWTYVRNNDTGDEWQVLGLYGQRGIYI